MRRTNFATPKRGQPILGCARIREGRPPAARLISGRSAFLRYFKGLGAFGFHAPVGRRSAIGLLDLWVLMEAASPISRACRCSC